MSWFVPIVFAVRLSPGSRMRLLRQITEEQRNTFCRRGLLLFGPSELERELNWCSRQFQCCMSWLKFLCCSSCRILNWCGRTVCHRNSRNMNTRLDPRCRQSSRSQAYTWSGRRNSTRCLSLPHTRGSLHCHSCQESLNSTCRRLWS